jgi:hypothetical protein
MEIHPQKVQGMLMQKWTHKKKTKAIKTIVIEQTT